MGLCGVGCCVAFLGLHRDASAGFCCNADAGPGGWPARSTVMRRALVIVVGVWMWATASARVVAAPIPSGPEAGVAAAHFEATLADATARTVDAYMQVGHRDPAWDADALSLLGGAARWMAGHPNRPRLWDLVQAGWRAREAGCRDPMVDFCYGYMLGQWDNPGAYTPLRRAAGGWGAREYGNLMRALACVSLARSARSHQGEVDRGPAWELATAETIEAIEAGELDGASARVAAHWLSALIGSSDAPEEHAERIIEAVAAREALAADPWLLHLLRGLAAEAVGARARGTGWANTVTEEGWKTLREQVAEAGGHLLRAWETDPTRPESAAALIRICKLGDGPDERDARDWFDAAVAVEMDYTDAYIQYLDYLLPRWHGGLWELIEFGRECAATERYDTLVPFFFITAVSRAGADTIGIHEVWDDPDLYDLGIEVARRMAASPAHSLDSGKYVSVEAAIAWLGGDIDEASRLMESIGDHVDKRTLWVLKVDWKLMIEEVERRRTFTPY